MIIFAFIFGWMRLLTVTALIQGIANFGLAYFLEKRVGLGGITLALVIVLLPQLVILVARLGRFLEVNIVALLGACVIRALIPLGSAAFCSLMVHRMVVIRQRHFFGLLAETLTFIAVYAVLTYSFVLFDDDRQQVKRYVGNFVGRGRSVPRCLARAFGSGSD